MPGMPLVQPSMRLPSSRANEAAWPRLYDESKIFPVEQDTPMYWTVISSPRAAGVPEPTVRSSEVSDAGGSPTGTGTSGAPAGSVSSNATHGLPSADSRAAAVVVDDVVAA